MSKRKIFMKIPGRMKSGILERCESDELIGEDIEWESDLDLVGQMGRPQAIHLQFKCYAKGCKSTWHSGKVTAIVYANRDRGQKIRIGVGMYVQRCKQCNAAGRPFNEADLEGIERIHSKVQLILGLREGIIPEKGPDSKMPPHEYGLCEACKSGKCVVGLSKGIKSLMNNFGTD
jgi:hypothetical protein